MFKQLLKKLFIAVPFLLLLVFSVQIFAGDDTFTLAQSYPLDTNLRAPGIQITQKVWLKMINGAKHTIDLGSLYFTDKKGQDLHPVVLALRSAALRGVKIRMIFDSGFFKDSKASIDELKKVPNIKINIMPMKLITSGMMHAKYMVVDGKDVYIGSANMDWRSLMHIHEMGARIQNKALAKQVTKVFNHDWQLSSYGFVKAESWFNWYVESILSVDNFNAIYHGKNLSFKLYGSPPTLLPYGINWELPALINLLDHAKKSILVQVLDFSPGPTYDYHHKWLELYNALVRANDRGVKARLILSSWAVRKKASLPYLKKLNSLPNITIKISYIPKYKNENIPFARVEHLKYAVIDNDKVWLGTGNWEWPYFYTTRNFSLIIDSGSVNGVLKKVFYHDWFGKYVRLLKR